MTTQARFAHNDGATVPVEWRHGGAQTPAGVPDDYGDVNWSSAEFCASILEMQR